MLSGGNTPVIPSGTSARRRAILTVIIPASLSFRLHHRLIKEYQLSMPGGLATTEIALFPHHPPDHQSENHRFTSPIGGIASVSHFWVAIRALWRAIVPTNPAAAPHGRCGVFEHEMGPDRGRPGFHFDGQYHSTAGRPHLFPERGNF
jgi:hypothetical protein